MSRKTQKKTFTTKDGIKIYYQTCCFPKSNRETLVLLHGAGGSLSSWNQINHSLHKKNYQTISIDLRGHGLSDKPPKEEDYQLKLIAKDVLGIIKHEKIKQVVLVGHCFGGIIAQILAASKEKIIKSIVLISTTYKAPWLTKISYKYKWQHLFFKILKTALPNIEVKRHRDFSKYAHTYDISLRRFLSDLYHTSPNTYYFISRHVNSINHQKLLKKIKVPTLIMVGDKDIICPPALSQNMSDIIKNAQLEIIEGANHILIINRAEEISQQIVDFIN